MNKLDGKLITAVIEKPLTQYPEFLAIKFTGIQQADICASVAKFREKKNEPATNCTSIGNAYYVVGLEDNILEMWPDLTSKIRLK